jgi:hypothetical protein
MRKPLREVLPGDGVKIRRAPRLPLRVAAKCPGEELMAVKPASFNHSPATAKGVATLTRDYARPEIDGQRHVVQ